MKSILFSAAVVVSSFTVAGSAMADDSANRCLDSGSQIEVYQSADLTVYDLCSTNLQYSARLVRGNLEIHRRGKKGGRCGKPIKIGAGAKQVNVTPDAITFINDKGAKVREFSVPKQGRGQGVSLDMSNDAVLFMNDTNGDFFWRSSVSESDCP